MTSLYIVNNKHLHKTNMEIQYFNIRQNTSLHPPTSSLTKFQKGDYMTLEITYKQTTVFNE